MPRRSTARIVHFDGHEMELEWEPNREREFPTNKVVFRKVAPWWVTPERSEFRGSAAVMLRTSGTGSLVRTVDMADGKSTGKSHFLFDFFSK